MPPKTCPEVGRCVVPCSADKPAKEHVIRWRVSGARDGVVRGQTKTNDTNDCLFGHTTELEISSWKMAGTSTRRILNLSSSCSTVCCWPMSRVHGWGLLQMELITVRSSTQLFRRSVDTPVSWMSSATTHLIKDRKWLRCVLTKKGQNEYFANRRSHTKTSVLVQGSSKQFNVLILPRTGLKFAPKTNNSPQLWPRSNPKS